MGGDSQEVGESNCPLSFGKKVDRKKLASPTKSGQRTANKSRLRFMTIPVRCQGAPGLFVATRLPAISMAMGSHKV